jgi:hypothetical protein
LRLPKTLLVVAVSSAAAFGVAACGDDDNDTSTSAGSSATTTASGGEASVSFVEPTDGATVSNPVTAEVQVENFTLNAQAVGKENVEGEGHLHFSMDDGKYDYPKYSGPNGDLAKQLGVQGQYSPATEPTITYDGLPAGEHTLTVDLVNNDHTETGTSATVTFTVEK